MSIEKYAKKVDERQKKVKEGIEFLKDYMDTYNKQPGYLDYTDYTIIEDILYGLGVAIDKDKYSFANGFKDFKEVLINHIMGVRT